MRIDRSRGVWRATWAAPIAGILMGSGVLPAQDQMRVAVTGGVSSDQRGVSSRAMTLAPTITFMSSSGPVVSLDGNFTRFDNQAWSAGAGAGLEARNQMSGPFSLAFNASGNATRLDVAGTSASFFTAEASPTVELELGSLTLVGGGRAAVGRISQDETRRLVKRKTGDTTSANVTSAGIGPSLGASVTSSPKDGEMIRVGARGDRMFIAGERVDDWTLSAAIMNSISTFSGTLGMRRATDERSSYGGANLAININASVALVTGAGRYPSNRLTGALAGNYFNVGFAFGSPAQP